MIWKQVLPTKMHPYLNTYLNTYIHAYMQAVLGTHDMETGLAHENASQADLGTYIHKYTHTYIHTYIDFPYIHTCIPAYIHTYIHAGCPRYTRYGNRSCT